MSGPPEIIVPAGYPVFLFQTEENAKSVTTSLVTYLIGIIDITDEGDIPPSEWSTVNKIVPHTLRYDAKVHLKGV